jgi:Xaa-Pro dipeptidase
VPVTDNPGCFLVYKPGSKPRLLFRRPHDFWHKPPTLPEEPWTQAVEVVAIADPSEAPPHWQHLGHVAFLGPAGSFPATDPNVVNHEDQLSRLQYDRAVKTPYELECLRRATALGVLGHRAALAAFRSGASEYHAHMQYLEACAQREEEMPYNNIVAYNENAAVLHYQHLARRPPRDLHSFLIDAGAQFRGYAADITRTHAGGAGRFADLIAATDRAQQRLCGEILAGRDYRDVHLTAHRWLGDVLHETGITNVTGDSALERGVTRVFFPHGIGHLLGLQVHDVGGVMGDLSGKERERPVGHPYLRLTRMLEPGVVVTVEPGLYFIDSLLTEARADAARASLIDWNVVEELRPFGGIRIEDNVVATAGRPENMTRDAFARLPA